MCKIMIRVYAFDLDNTLYDHQNFVEGAYRDVAQEVEKNTAISAKDFYFETFNKWKLLTSRCDHIFSDTLKKYDQYSLKLEKKLVDVYRNHVPKIKPYNYVIEGFLFLKKKAYLALLSDGQSYVQQRKLSVLELEYFFDLIIYTGTFGRSYYKPHPIGFQKICRKLNVTPDKVSYIGDNPYTDFKTPKKMGMKTIRIKIGEYKNIPHNQQDVDYEYDSIELFFKSFL